MSHVFILTATNDRVPRWFTEGLAVHEEGERSPEWSDRATPEVLAAIRDKKLLPVAELDRGFVYPGVPVAGDRLLLPGRHHLRLRQGKMGRRQASRHGSLLTQNCKTTPQAMQQNLGCPAEEFDKQYLAWIESEVRRRGRALRRMARKAEGCCIRRTAETI